MSVLITAEELDSLRRRPGLRILDVRWALAVPDGRPAYLERHLPGAVYVDLESDLAGCGAATDGRHPLPAVGDLQDAARSWGIDQGDTVVVYDDAANLAAARCWWLLRWAGIARVRLLDGGLAAWQAAGLPLESGQQAFPAGDVVLTGGHLPVVDADDVETLATGGVLLDARAGERFRGETEPVDPRAGHIPGAVSAPTAENVDADGRFLAPETLRTRFATLGISSSGPVAAYCGSGVTAAHEIAALELAGYSAALYPGSWSAWSNDADRPVATGP